MRKLLLLVIIGSVFSALMAAPLKVGFVYVSPIGDAGWTYQHNMGRIAIEKKFGSKIEVRYFESIKEGPESERVIRKLASSGYDLIFTTSFGFMNPTIRVAKAFPKVYFEQATGYKKSKNVSNYSPRFYEGRYLAGIAAASKSKKAIVGYIAAFPIPEVIRGINSFTLGARSVNPNIKVKIIWTSSWFNPSKESEAAKTLILNGADILTHHTDSIAAVKTAKDKGVYAIAYHSDMTKHGGSAQIGAVVHNWEKYYTSVVEKVLNKTWKSSSVWLGIKEGMVDFIVSDSLDKATKDKIKKAKQEIISGKLNIFSGPIKDNKGKLRVNSKSSLSDSSLAKMNYFVEGVDGKLPK
jgi:simple sugar transport system substrate-binding protein